ncbi:hypothetical protein [Mesorhizobium sp. M3A.F.Ca.ET.080.04.2.1]|uniref:hypothetical protein n=1 Tax=Mesorhizobium sp. M3A.F.Ca.ET.080.04.2.1 TaxID=2493676 RepID=UPI001FE0911B|nr:hypothetical protein [Mesorhizobium sp. M3A.F.Ca.ET.080.04.2.1]
MREWRTEFSDKFSYRSSEGAKMLSSHLAELVEQNHLAWHAFAKGDPEPLKYLYSRQDDVIIANPFGPPAKGSNNAAATMDRAATHYRDGEATGFERISEYARRI